MTGFTAGDGASRAVSYAEIVVLFPSPMPAALDQNLRIDPAELPGEDVIFGSTPAMREVRGTIDSALSSDLPVLVRGETGTGKEVIARFLHVRSNRAEKPFVKLNCAATPASRLERELFGVEQGSFAGAAHARPGLLEIAEGGTLYLNEIGPMSPDLRDKLVRVVRDGSYVRIGGGEKRSARTRIVCATALPSAAFAEELFSGLAFVSLQLSPLRDRKQDIPCLCDYFLQKLSRQFRRSMPRLSPSTLELLKQWNWPGNLRELENWIARTVILGGDEALALELRRQLGPTHASTGPKLRRDVLEKTTDPATSLVTGALINKSQQANWQSRRRTVEKLKTSSRALLFRLRSAGMPRKRRGHKSSPGAS